MSFKSWSSGLDAQGKAKTADMPAVAVKPPVPVPSHPTDKAPAVAAPAGEGLRSEGLPRQAQQS